MLMRKKVRKLVHMRMLICMKVCKLVCMLICMLVRKKLYIHEFKTVTLFDKYGTIATTTIFVYKTIR